MGCCGISTGRLAASCSGLRVRSCASTILGGLRAGGSDWSVAEEAEVLGGGDPGQRLGHALEVNALTLDGADGSTLVANWSWARSLIPDEEVRPWRGGGLRRWRRWCAMRRMPGAGGRSPSDVALAGLRQGEIEDLEGRYREIEDILPLSPLQEGLLFHALYDTVRRTSIRFNWFSGLRGEIDPAGLEAAAGAWLGGMRACGLGSARGLAVLFR